MTRAGGERLRPRVGSGFGFAPPLSRTLPLHSEIRCDETVLAHFASEACSVFFVPIIAQKKEEKKALVTEFRNFHVLLSFF